MHGGSFLLRNREQNLTISERASSSVLPPKLNCLSKRRCQAINHPKRLAVSEGLEAVGSMQLSSIFTLARIQVLPRSYRKFSSRNYTVGGIVIQQRAG